ncbi:MAG: hypothetical protein Q8N23_30700 [Archangium sp.]|nr:hypothetical protein [Archangium sp.]MDP3157081.1 hypothetical protein [Archangium sp.]MDP3575798.1 hypothetical protein [Archangium sp.]
MSVGSSVFLKRSAMPTSARWAAAIREAGFPLKLDERFDVLTFDGFLPCEYQGVAAGFEYTFRAADTSALSAADRERVGDRDVEIVFTTHSGMRNLVSAIIAGGVLAQLSDGVHWDHEAGVISGGPEALEFARGQVVDLGPELENAGGDFRPADLSTAQAVDVSLEATVVFRGGSLLTLETHEPAPRRFDLSLVTEELPKADQVRIVSLWHCSGRPAVVRRFSIKASGFFKKTQVLTFDAWGRLQLEPGQVDLKKWIAKLGQVEAATKMLLAGGVASVPLLLEAAGDSKLPLATRQLAVGVLGALGPVAVSAVPQLQKLASNAELAGFVARSLSQINKH